MKKILSWCNSHIEWLCASFLFGCGIYNAVHGDYSTALLYLPFVFMWVLVYRLQKEILRLARKNEELKETNEQLEKAYKEMTKECNRINDIKTLCYYRYLLAQNNVDLCKKEISCGEYLSKRKLYEDMIELYLNKVWSKYM
nr:MAG TPA: Septum formation initiator [Caudoviricetes sp.]